MNSIHPNAKIGKDVKIGPFTVIEEDVVIGDGTEVMSNVVIMNGARIGKNCKIFPGAVLSAAPQDLKYKGEETYLKIGDNTTIRECCTLNKGTAAAGETLIGSNCLIMAYVHVAHDCIVGDHVILANATNLAGHVTIEDHSILGGMVAVHQFVKIGAHAMVGGGSLVRIDVPPFVKASREPLSYIGVNSIGLQRRGFSEEEIKCIKEVYHTLYISELNRQQSIEKIKIDACQSKYTEQILDFIEKSERGIIRGFKSSKEN